MERERKKNESTLVDEDGSLREMGLLEGGGVGGFNYELRGKWHSRRIIKISLGRDSASP